MKEILPPTNCPECSSELVWVNDLLYCVDDSCAGKSQKIVGHFAASLKIKGLGPATISKLELTDINDIYALNREDVITKLSSTALADKLLTQIENSKSADLQTLLGSFSIPLFGKTASEKLCSHINSIQDITEQKLLEAGLGSKTIQSFMRWFKTDFEHKYRELPFTWQTSAKLTAGGPIVVISGRLTSFKTKELAKGALQKAGYTVKTSITKDTDFLVNESDIASAKTHKAESMGICIVTDIKDLLEI